MNHTYFNVSWSPQWEIWRDGKAWPVFLWLALSPDRSYFSTFSRPPGQPPARQRWIPSDVTRCANVPSIMHVFCSLSSPSQHACPSTYTHWKREEMCCLLFFFVQCWSTAWDKPPLFFMWLWVISFLKCCRVCVVVVFGYRTCQENQLDPTTTVIFLSPPSLLFMYFHCTIFKRYEELTVVWDLPWYKVIE